MGVEGGDQDLQQYRNAQGSDGRQEKIFVSVRLRPLNDKEIQCNDFADWESINNNTILFKNCLGERSMYPNAYTFDRVFGHDDSTRKVYEEAAKEIALSVLNGINSSVFAYGQTSSGKTFTMSGITQYAVADIYNYIDQRKEREFVLKFSAIEIYNELVRDLLSVDTTPLRLLDDPERGTVVEKLTEETLRDKSHLLELIAVCEAQRQTGETTLNETSSRSHQILRLTIESSARQFGGGNSSMLAANVNFVDLAGSERTSQTLATGARLKEGSHINRSLLTLGKVIRTLSKGRNGHIPYRDSKLTRILQNSIGGNARTAIICTMSPAHSHLEQSRNTLLFASCAKEVTTNAQVNVVMSDKALVKQLRKELARLETDLKNMSMVSAKGDVAAVLREKEQQIEKMEKEIKELSRQRDLAQSRVEELLRSTRKKQVSEAQTDDEFNYHRPESREKISWLDDSSEASDMSDYQRLDADLATSETLQYIDEPRGLDLATQSSDLLANIDNIPLPEESLMQPLDNTILQPTPDHPPPVIRTDKDSEDNCKEVRCIEVEEASINKESEVQDPVKFSPEEKDIQNDDEFEPKYTTISAVEKESGESENKYSISAEDKDSHLSDTEPLSFENKKEVKDSHLSDTEPLSYENKKEITESRLSDTEPLSYENKKEVTESRQSDTEHLSCGNKKEIKESRLSDTEPLSYENKKEIKASHLSDTEPLSYENKKESKPHHNNDAEHEALVKKIKALQRTIDMLVNRNYHLSNLSPSSTDSDKSSTRGSSFNRSRSCKAILTSSPTLEKGMISRDATSFGGFDKEMSSEKPKGLPRGSVHGKPSRLCLSVPSIRSAIKNEMERDHVKLSDDNDASNFYSSLAGSNGDAAYESDKQTDYETDGQTEEQTEPKDSECSGSACPVNSYMMRVRDCMSEGAISTVQSPLNNWYNEFESQRFKIIELWHACHIPLVHRTYFYLLFKDDPSDKIYIEVELRRLCFIKSRFDQGQKIVMDGQVFTPASSIRALNQEREMLMRQMNKKIPGKQREALFDRWGIALNSKQRRRQLAQRLWTDTKDMQHIRESADLVAKLIGFVGEGQVPKEMFVGPSVGSKSINRRSYSWKSGMSLVT